MAEKSAGRGFDQEKGLNPTRGDPMEFEQGIQELITRAQAGDKLAENELFAKLHARFLGVVRHKIWNPKRDSKAMQQDVEDVVSEIIQALCNVLRKDPMPKEHFMATAHAIAHNKIVDYIRRKELAKKSQPLAMDFPLPEEEQPNGAYAKCEAKEIILRVLPKLQQRDKEILSAFLEDRIKEYIKEQCRAMSRNRVDTHIHRFRQRLAKLLQKEGLVV